MDSDQALIVLTTVADEASARKLADGLVAARVAACVTCLGGAVSTYCWEGRKQRDTEVLMLIKTTAAAYPALAEEVERLHDYELPELLAVPVDRGSPAYLSWLGAAVASGEQV